MAVKLSLSLVIAGCCILLKQIKEDEWRLTWNLKSLVIVIHVHRSVFKFMYVLRACLIRVYRLLQACNFYQANCTSWVFARHLCVALTFVLLILILCLVTMCVLSALSLSRVWPTSNTHLYYVQNCNSACWEMIQVLSFTHIAVLSQKASIRLVLHTLIRKE